MSRQTTAERPTLVRFQGSHTLHIAADSDSYAMCSSPCTTACGLTKVPAFVAFADHAKWAVLLERLCSNCTARWRFVSEAK
jgi:hypothetical protein